VEYENDVVSPGAVGAVGTDGPDEPDEPDVLHSNMIGHATSHVTNFRPKLSEPPSEQSETNVLYTATMNAYKITTSTTTSIAPNVILRLDPIFFFFFSFSFFFFFYFYFFFYFF
jgi:hypothetical protein